MDKCTYADSFGIMSNLTDVKIDFSITDPRVEEGENVVDPNPVFEHRIVMSLPLAKDLAKKLTAAVSNYERAFGSIVDLGGAQTQDKENG